MFFFSMKHACGDGGYLLTRTMIYHFLENDSFFFYQELFFWVAVTSPNACNSGKAFNRQGRPPFPSLKMHYVYYYLVKGGGEELPAPWLCLSFEQGDIFTLMFCLCWSLKTGLSIWQTRCIDAETFCSPSCNFSTADSSSAPITVRNAV